MHLNSDGFIPAREGSVVAEIFENASEPYVLRGVAVQWPALQRWTFAHLSTLGHSRPVTLVAGNRELNETEFVTSTFGEYLAGLMPDAVSPRAGVACGYLKEFDLLKAFPSLRGDLDTRELFPAGSYVSSSAWIGPKGARTGLHCDLLDNTAVLVRGAKRFYLARPGIVEAQRALSPKYDRWARLANMGIDELATRSVPPDALLYADLHPGDAIYVPRGWWHEVVNLQSSIFLSGFHGPHTRVIGQWLWTGARQLLHNANVFGRQACTCHTGA